MNKPEPMSNEQIAYCIFEARSGELNPALARNGTLSFRIARAVEAARDAAWQAREDAAPKQDDADRQLLRALFEVCEATEEECADSQDSFKRGRAWEAKSIRRGVGTWYQDTFCGPTHMGEPVVAPRTYTQAEVDALVAQAVAQFIEGVNIDRLSRALTKMGCAHEASQEAIAASLADHVNALTRAIQASDMTDAAIRASCATTVFLTALEAQADDADDLGVQGWLDLAEERIRKGV